MPDAAPYQSLYRRYRPQRFGELRGQEHVTRALRNAVREGRVAHAYLFSGPRGTGKTSTARILAKALNCAKPDEGEPCGICDSCVAVQHGASFDVIELDAASNSKVDDMRDLLSRIALGTPGRWKVYIVDEVHMLSPAASNALLKTLEEPPAQVLFVLATTEAQKVLPTIRSRTQHFEFHLLAPDLLGELVRTVNDDAGLGLGPHDLDAVVRRGGGSARDTLSLLDQAAAAGGAEQEVAVTDEVVEALCERDTGQALRAVAHGCAAGRDPRRLAEDVLAHLRNAFLVTVSPALAGVPAHAVPRVADQAQRMGRPALVRAMEVVGEALAQMRDALDPRVTLEVALVRVTAPEADTSPAALAERLDRLERRLSAPAPPAPPAPPARPAPPSAPPAPPPDRVTPVIAAATTPTTPTTDRPSRALGAFRAPASPATPASSRAADSTTPPAPPSDTERRPPGRPVPSAGARPPAEPGAPPPPAVAPSGRLTPSREEVTKAWGDVVLPALPQRIKARFGLGRFVSTDEGSVVFALPDRFHLPRCEELRTDVERALSDHFHVPLRLRLVVDAPGGPVSATGALDGDNIDIDIETLTDAPPLTSPAERLKRAFPGAEEVEP